jgi:hypothetical protein
MGIGTKSLVFALMIVLFSGANLRAQNRDLIVLMTTPIEVHFTDSVPNYGSGFYFQKLAPADPAKGDWQWRAVTGLYLVTAKHVIQPERIKKLKGVSFYLRRPGTSGIDWLPINLSPEEVQKRLHLAANPDADVAVLDILDLLNKEIFARAPKGLTTGGPQNTPIETYFAATEDNFPGKSKIKISAGDDVVVIGYPRHFFDEYNKLPILKAGLLITPLGVRYDNLDAFLIDFREYEGLSGSVIISKPTDVVVEDGKIFTHNGGRDFLLLGVYTGQRYRKNKKSGEEEGPDVGIGWYYYNLTSAIDAPPYFSSKQ